MTELYIKYKKCSLSLLSSAYSEQRIFYPVYLAGWPWGLYCAPWEAVQ